MTDIQRFGDFMQCFSGRPFWPLDPRPEEIEIGDIAHSLSMQCRYLGHCHRFYSVAEHCVHLARYVSAPNRLWALLHDASEAYLVDVPRPVKPFLVGYREAEAKMMETVRVRFGLVGPMPREVEIADWRIIGDERANLSESVLPWTSPPEPLGIELQFWSPPLAESEFLAAFEELS